MEFSREKRGQYLQNKILSREKSPARQRKMQDARWPFMQIARKRKIIHFVSY
jgi:hypothetical protein